MEGLNRAVESMFLAALPGYVRQPRPGRRRARPKDEVLLGFEDFTARLLDWVAWWNTFHHPGPLKGRSPLEVWEADPTPLREIGADELWTFTLEDDGRTRVVSTKGIRFRNRDYVGLWMTGEAGLRVRVRFMPHHDHRIEVFDAATGRYLGPATLADQARRRPGRRGLHPALGSGMDRRPRLVYLPGARPGRVPRLVRQ